MKAENFGSTLGSIRLHTSVGQLISGHFSSLRPCSLAYVVRILLTFVVPAPALSPLLLLQ